MSEAEKKKEAKSARQAAAAAAAVAVPPAAGSPAAPLHPWRRIARFWCARPLRLHRPRDLTSAQRYACPAGLSIWQHLCPQAEWACRV